MCIEKDVWIGLNCLGSVIDPYSCRFVYVCRFECNRENSEFVFLQNAGSF